MMSVAVFGLLGLLWDEWPFVDWFVAMGCFNVGGGFGLWVELPLRVRLGLICVLCFSLGSLLVRGVAFCGFCFVLALYGAGLWLLDCLGC